MPVEDPEVKNMIVSTAAGLVGGAVASLSKPMNRREVFYCLIGGLGIGAFLSPALVAYFGLQWFIAGGISFILGLSVFGLIPLLQMATLRFTSSKIGSDLPSQNPPGGGGP